MYHEQKVSEGKAELFYSNFRARNNQEKIYQFLNTADANPEIRKNKFVHFSVSFPKADGINVDQVKMLEIGRQYLDEMGYTDTPVLMYEHQDKAHSHFHIVTTTMDFNGVKILEYNDHYKSQQLSRKLEKSFGLTETIYERKQGLKLMEINATRYKIFNALPAIDRDPILKQQFLPLIGEDLYAEVSLNKFKDSEAKQQFLLRGKNDKDFDEVFRFLSRNGLENKTYKEMLLDRLKSIKTNSLSRDSFLASCETEGLYVRKIANPGNSYNITYGIPEKNFYVLEKDLPVAFRFDYLFTGKKLELSFNESDQKNYLNRLVTRCLKESNSKTEFEKALNENNIEFKYSENKRGIYGVSFKSKNVKEPIEFKGSELDRKNLSWNQLAKKLNIPVLEKEKQIQPESGKSATNPLQILKPLLRPIKDVSKESNEQKRREKKARGEDRDQDREDF
jgi:hypothetical protein